jgi:NADH dehydrogenase
MYLGKWAGHNAINDLFSATLKPYTNTSYVTCLDLGQNDGLFTTGWERNLLYKGSEGKGIKMNINERLIYPSDNIDDAIVDSYPEIPVTL